MPYWKESEAEVSVPRFSSVPLSVAVPSPTAVAALVVTVSGGRILPQPDREIL